MMRYIGTSIVGALVGYLCADNGWHLMTYQFWVCMVIASFGMDVHGEFNEED